MAAKRPRRRLPPLIPTPPKETFCFSLELPVAQALRRVADRDDRTPRAYLRRLVLADLRAKGALADTPAPTQEASDGD
jgi:hypothetical protein